MALWRSSAADDDGGEHDGPLNGVVGDLGGEPRRDALHVQDGTKDGGVAGDQGVVIDDTKLFNDKLQEWEDFYKLQPTPRRPRRTNTLRMAKTENPEPGVSHKVSGTRPEQTP